MTLLTRVITGRPDAGRVMSVVGLPMVLGPMLGPTLGGRLVEDAS
jgi:MFS family permease